VRLDGVGGVGRSERVEHTEGLGGNRTPGGCELKVFAVEISRISWGSCLHRLHS
jgi:hypothetical protein